ncbi:ribosome recycling factor [Myxococcota bacterium]|nr:ribosome recycling factor [Myxococcota bacterium]MBU1379309.1 ribosome recycling factor [Myxococcota bacterium]MBU1498797.1 ribosome recycling factor [Myxococcota bacterium]
MVDDVIKSLKESMDSVISALKKELVKVRTGRANLSMLDGISVEYYGTPTPLNQVANLQVADARLITVKPWEKSMLTPIEKALVGANLGITPSNDGEIIRLPIPPLTEERRRDIVKKIKSDGEEFKIRLRNERRDCNDLLKSLEKDKEITEDDMHKGLTRVNDTTNEYVKKIDDILTEKEKEILAF